MQRPKPTADTAAPSTLSIDLDFPSHPHPASAPSAMLHIPSGFDGFQPWGVVVFLHGWNGCARVLMNSGPSGCERDADGEIGWELGSRHDAALTNTLLLVPQLAYRKREGDAGRFTEPGYARAYLAQVAARVGDRWPRTPPGQIVLVAHSAGFETAAAWLRQGTVSVDVIILMDALYAETESFAQWVTEDASRKLLSFHTGHGSTARQNRRLERLLRRREVHVAHDLRENARARVIVSAAPHREVPSSHLSDALRASELPSRSLGGVSSAAE